MLLFFLLQFILLILPLKGGSKFKTMKKIFFIALFGFLSCHSQITYKPIPQVMIPEKYESTEVKSLTESKLGFYDLTESLPKNYVQDGSADYTDYLQKGILANKNVMFPDFPVLINDKGLDVISNSVINFQDNSKIILQTSNKETYEMLRLHQVENVTIYNAHLVGDREKHIGSTGEWGMGIAIRSSKNINVINSRIEKCWGDGIYVGQIWVRETGKKAKLLEISSNINIYNTIADYNRRNGLSIVAVNGINVISSLFSNSIGTFPKAGIDIEPGDVDNVSILNTNTYNNGARGIDIMLRSIAKNKIKKINVEIQNHKDLSSAIGIRIAGYKDLYPSDFIKPIAGKITIINPEWNKNKYSTLVIEPNQSVSPEINIQNVKATDMNSKKITIEKLKLSSKVKEGLKSSKKIKIE